MKINFGSTYRDVEQILKASLKPNVKADEAGFEKSLGSLLSQPPESPKKTGDVLRIRRSINSGVISAN